MQTYLLGLAQNKYYVGRTTDLDRRLRQHWTKDGAKWTKKYHPKRVMHILKGDREKELTLRAMDAFGVPNVRGAGWCRVCPIDEPVELWMRSMVEQEDSCKEKLSPTMSVSTLNQTSISNWAISDPVKNKHGTFEFHIATKGTKVHPRVQITSNKLPMRCPFGCSQFNDQGSLSINFCVAPYMEDVQAFFTQADRWILDWAWEHRQQVFGNKIPTTKEVMENMYTPMMTPAKGDFDPLIRSKISASTPVWLVTESGTTKGSVADVVPHSSCCPVISFDKVWCMAGRFGVTLRTQALLCHPRQEQSLEDLFSFDPMEE